jgi:hypothetical protein
MSAKKLFLSLTAYYIVVVLIVWVVLYLFPGLRDSLPVGGVKAIITQADRGLLEGNAIPPADVKNIAESLAWLGIAMLGALVTSLPVSWIYMSIRSGDEYDQSLISTILILPLVVTAIVIVVQNSLSLAFALGGIAGAVRFKNSLKSSGDALFILLSVGIGLASGIGAVELALIMSVGFNFCFLILWITEYGEREGMKRYMSDIDPTTCPTPPPAPEPPTAAPPGDPPASS